MSEAKFTKGEWVVQFGDMVFSSDGVNNEQVAAVCNDDNNDVHLIAAAPEMYAMLKTAISYMDGDSVEDFTYHYQEIKQLLAKARGE